MTVVPDAAAPISHAEFVQLQNGIKGRLTEELFDIQENRPIRVLGVIKNVRWCGVEGHIQMNETQPRLMTEFETTWLVQTLDSTVKPKAHITGTSLLCVPVEEGGRKVAERLIQFLAKRD